MSSIDALVKVEQAVAERLIQKMINQSHRVQMKIFGTDEVHEVVVRRTPRKKHFELLYKGKVYKDKKQLTFKIEVATRVFFFKVESIPTTKLIQLPDSLEIFELARRREPRFKVPKEWEQSAVMSSEKTPELKSIIKIRDISTTGMKFVVMPPLDLLNDDEIITIQFKLNKAQQISVKAKVRHSHKNLVGGPTVGVMFIDTTDLLRTKLRKVCDDIAFYIAQLNNIF